MAIRKIRIKRLEYCFQENVNFDVQFTHWQLKTVRDEIVVCDLATGDLLINGNHQRYEDFEFVFPGQTDPTNLDGLRDRIYLSVSGDRWPFTLQSRIVPYDLPDTS